MHSVTSDGIYIQVCKENVTHFNGITKFNTETDPCPSKVNEVSSVSRFVFCFHLLNALEVKTVNMQFMWHCPYASPWCIVSGKLTFHQ